MGLMKIGNNLKWANMAARSFFLLGSLGFSHASLAVPLNALEVPLTEFQKERLLEDYPFTDAVVRDQADVFLLGSEYLWKWELKKLKMSRVKLPLEKVKKIAMRDFSLKERFLLPYSKNGFIIADRKAILYVNLDPLKIKKIAYPKTFAADYPIATFLDGKILYVMFSAGSWVSTKIMNHGFSTLRIRNNPLGKIGSFQNAKLSPLQHTLFLSNGGRLLAINNWPRESSAKDIINTAESIMSLEISKNSLYASTKRHVLKFQSDTQQLMQILPIASEKNLQSLALDHLKHAYVLQDNNLYLYDLKNEARLVYKLPFTKSAGASSIHFLKRMGTHKYALLKDGFPFVFSLPQKI